MRFRSYGWNVLHVEHGDEYVFHGHGLSSYVAQEVVRDFDSIEKAITEAQQNKSAPTIINLKTTIGFGSLKAGGHDVHGSRKLYLQSDFVLQS